MHPLHVLARVRTVYLIWEPVVRTATHSPQDEETHAADLAAVVPASTVAASVATTVVHQPDDEDHAVQAAAVTSNSLSSEPEHAHASDAITWDAVEDEDPEGYEMDL